MFIVDQDLFSSSPQPLHHPPEALESEPGEMQSLKRKRGLELEDTKSYVTLHPSCPLLFTISIPQFP